MGEGIGAVSGIAAAVPARRRVAVVTGDTLGPRLSGPGIRALELAKVLSDHHEVRLVSTLAADLQMSPVDVCAAVTEADVKDLEAWCDVLVFQGFLLNRNPWLMESSCPIVVDLYDPFHLEVLEQGRALPLEERNRQLFSTVGVVNQQLARGDYFICASAKQRDFWLGQLTAIGRLNAHTYDRDKSLRSLIDVVPFGISDTVPPKDSPVLRGVVDGIGRDDRVLLWGGGLYPWFDPHTLVRAVDRLRANVPTVRLVFLAGRHPNPDVPPMPTAEEVRSLTAELGLGRHVFFVDHWVEYRDRHNYLLEADLGLSTHLHHVETEFSFRTRILDYIWAGLPVVTTGGDAMGDLVEREGLGRVVPPGDVEALASALEELLADAEALASCRERLAKLAPSFHWPSVAAALVAFCGQPSRAPDLVSGVRLPPVSGNGAPPLQSRLRRAVELTRRSLRDDGVMTTGQQIALRIRRGAQSAGNARSGSGAGLSGH